VKCLHSTILFHVTEFVLTTGLKADKYRELFYNTYLLYFVATFVVVFPVIYPYILLFFFDPTLCYSPVTDVMARRVEIRNQ
jgi:hypothetical protein